MCGIAGIYSPSGLVSEHLIKKMTDSIVHRGPDGEGCFVNGPIGLGHRRLAILDLTDAGKQPMQTPDGKIIVTYNGEIYNHLELREELQKKGHIFTSRTDTEVLLHGYREWGIDMVPRLNGMFAFALWDTTTKDLYLVRDRFGIKPLYYWQNGNEIVFASEIKAILQHPDYKIGVDFNALNEYFTFQNLFRYHTLFKGIHSLPPANIIHCNSSGVVNRNSYWDFDFTNRDRTINEQDAVEETLRLFRQSVSRQMIADVRVGSYLSGGMDSGSITSVASSQYNRLTTFTCGFDMTHTTGREANFDERRDAEMMSSYFKTEHYEMVINAGDISWSMPRLIYHMEDLRVGMSYPNYYISRLASRFVKVCLSGTGGDELYGGYPWRYYRVFQSLDRPGFLKNYYSFWQRLVSDEDKTNLFTPNTIAQIDDINDPYSVFSRVFTFNKDLKYDKPEDHIANSLYFEAKTFLPGLFIMGDKLAMANSLEERFPFMDNDLVNFAQKIPIKYKLANLETMKKMDENETMKLRKFQMQFDDGKNVLRKAMKNLIPEAFINRKKQGFSAPDESWYRGENLAYVREILLSPNAASHEYINKKYIEQIIDEHVNKKINHRLLIWSLLSFEWWCKLFLQGHKIETIE